MLHSMQVTDIIVKYSNPAGWVVIVFNAINDLVPLGISLVASDWYAVYNLTWQNNQITAIELSETAPSGAGSIATQPNKPSVPDNFTVEATNTGAISISWDYTSGGTITGYQLNYNFANFLTGENPQFYTRIIPAASTNISLTDLIPSNTYGFQLAAFNQNSSGAKTLGSFTAIQNITVPVITNVLDNEGTSFADAPDILTTFAKNGNHYSKDGDYGGSGDNDFFKMTLTQNQDITIYTDYDNDGGNVIDPICTLYRQNDGDSNYAQIGLNV